MSDKPETAETKAEAKPAEKPKPAKPKKEKKQPSKVRLPFLLELTYTVSTLILIFLALAVIITSMFAGVSLFTIVLRTSVAVLAVGGLLILISSQISSGLLFAIKIEQEEAEKKREEELRKREEENKNREPDPAAPLMNEHAEMAEA